MALKKQRFISKCSDGFVRKRMSEWMNKWENVTDEDHSMVETFYKLT